MKKLFIALALALSTNGYAQDFVASNSVMYNHNYEESQPINLKLNSTVPAKKYYDEPQIPLGLGLISGGAVFMVAGFLTVPPMQAPGFTTPKPFFSQGGRMLAIVSGAGLMVVGCTISIAGR